MHNYYIMLCKQLVHMLFFVVMLIILCKMEKY